MKREVPFFNVEFDLHIDHLNIERPARLENVSVEVSINEKTLINYNFDGAFYQTLDGNWVDVPESSMLATGAEFVIEEAIMKKYWLIRAATPMVYDHVKIYNTCYERVGENEPVFTLRGNDKTSGKIVLEWIIANYDNLNCPSPKLLEAFECAMEMRHYGIANGKNAD